MFLRLKLIVVIQYPANEKPTECVMKEIFSGLFDWLFSGVRVYAKEAYVKKYCNYKDISLFTEAYNFVSGEDEAIVFLHGLGGNHTDGSFLYNSKNKYMTITIDMPNHGQSGKIQNLSWDVYVDAVKAVIDSYGINKVHFIGHSLGADTAMMYAKKYPEVITDIILLDRAYYNYQDAALYNFTSSLFKAMAYNPDPGFDYNSLCTLIDMSSENDITKTWDIKKDVLLLAANPFWAAPVKGEPSIVDYIAKIKKSPAEFGLLPEQAYSIPDISLKNLNDYMKFLDRKIHEFASKNRQFYAVKTPFEHAMVFNETAKPEILDYALEFINNKDKYAAVCNIEKRIKERTVKGKSFYNILNDCRGD